MSLIKINTVSTFYCNFCYMVNN